MADNPPEPPPKAKPPLPSSGMAGRAKAPTTKLPPLQAGVTGKIVVMLSSVAKAPATSQQMSTAQGAVAPPKVAPPLTPTGQVVRPPPLPAKKVMPAATPLPASERLSSTTFVKLPPKTAAPAFVSLAPKPAIVGDKKDAKVAPPLLPAKRAEPGTPAAAKPDAKNSVPTVLKPGPQPASAPPKSDLKKTGRIKLNPPGAQTAADVDSIFAEIPEPASPPMPEGWKQLQTGELRLPEGGLKASDPFEHSRRLEPKPMPVTPVPVAPPPLPVAPPIVANAKSEPTLNPAPVALPPAHPVNVAPPMVEKPHEVPPERLPQPHLSEPPKSGAVPEVASSRTPEGAAELHKAPPLADPGKAPAKPPPLPPPMVPDKEESEKPAPSVLTSTSRIFLPSADGKPALRPAVLPSRATRSSAEGPANSPAATDIPPAAEKSGEIAAAAAVAAGVAEAVSEPKSKRPALPPTRMERAKKRRLREVVLFWILVPIVAAGLYFGILYFGRDTRVEGQVIPPAGMTLSDEIWIVSDFSSLAAGVADDVAKERVPLQLAIQEAQDHVQRVQADIASREERIRLIQEEIQAAKDEMNGIIKKSQGDAQALYDSEGKDLDSEYASRMAALKQAVANRAASLKLQYQPDPAFPSPEVWANAYRLALYQTPPGVDGVKEHQWIADQMKQWRDYEKSMDDRYQQLRDQAAQLKQGIAPRVTDLNSKMDDMKQRIEGTLAEEEPLKAELKQAQSDLAAAQSTEASLDDKYYGQLYALPAENISYRIPVAQNGRFTWIPDNPFGEGEIEHNYILFSRAIRADGRQYWALHKFSMKKNEVSELTIEPGGFESTKAILRPNLPPDEIEE